jgi:hypothetical protein
LPSFRFALTQSVHAHDVTARFVIPMPLP